MIAEFNDISTAVSQVIYTAGASNELVLIQVYNQYSTTSEVGPPEPFVYWNDGNGVRNTEPGGDLGLYTFTLKLEANTPITVVQPAPPSGSTWSFYVGITLIGTL